MGLGSTAKKIQMMSDKAEQMYKQVQQLQNRIIHLEEEVDDTHDTVKNLDHQLTEQRELLLAIADERGIDGEEILAEAAIDEAEETADGEAESEANSAEAAGSKSTEGTATPTEQ
ncbi:DUF5798 family protein [Halostagnicola bangensis]